MKEECSLAERTHTEVCHERKWLRTANAGVTSSIRRVQQHMQHYDEAEQVVTTLSVPFEDGAAAW